MRSWPIFTALLANVAISTLFVQVDAAACADICYTTALTGFGPGGTPGCTCSGSQQGARTGAGGCNCGQCYEKTQGVVFGFAININGACTYGTDCGSCDYSAGSSGSTSGAASATSRPATATPSPAPATTAPSPTATTSPVPTTAAPSPTAGADLSSTSSSSTNSNSSSASTDNSNSSSRDGVVDATGSHAGSEENDKFLSTWQIVLAICCCVLIFVVAVVSVCACYCKARSRLYEHEDDQASYYHPPQTFQPWGANNTLLIATKTNSIVV